MPDAHDLPLIDRFIGWHLLVSPVPARKVYFKNCPKGLGSHWCKARGEVRVLDSNEADLYIDWCGGTGKEIEVFCTNNKSTAVRRYALVPPSNPRLVLPLENTRQLRRGLQLHQPGRKALRAVFLMMSGLAGLGITWPIGRRILAISADLNPLDFVDPGAVLYLGTADECRKTTILNPESDWIGKLGTNDRSKRAIRAEASALRKLAEGPISDRVPKLFHQNDAQIGSMFKQEFRVRTNRKVTAFDSELVDFLKDLSTIDYEWRNGTPGHYSHGDFAPWNVIWSQDSLFVFDWEESHDWAPALSDAFYFVLAPAFHIPGSVKISTAAHNAIKLGYRVAEAMGLDDELVPLLWKLWIESQAKHLSSHQITELKKLAMTDQ